MRRKRVTKPGRQSHQETPQRERKSPHQARPLSGAPHDTRPAPWTPGRAARVSWDPWSQAQAQSPGLLLPPQAPDSQEGHRASGQQGWAGSWGHPHAETLWGLRAPGLGDRARLLWAPQEEKHWAEGPHSPCGTPGMQAQSPLRTPWWTLGWSAPAPPGAGSDKTQREHTHRCCLPTGDVQLLAVVFERNAILRWGEKRAVGKGSAPNGHGGLPHLASARSTTGCAASRGPQGPGEWPPNESSRYCSSRPTLMRPTRGQADPASLLRQCADRHPDGASTRAPPEALPAAQCGLLGLGEDGPGEDRGAAGLVSGARMQTDLKDGPAQRLGPLPPRARRPSLLEEKNPQQVH